jgi:SAM-dependent methyltransferase
LNAHEDRGRALSFGQNAEGYERWRPGYPPELFDFLFELAPASPVIVEVGAGTGKATRVLAGRASGVVAIEPDAEMVSVLVRNTAGMPVQVVHSDFETWQPPTGAHFDVLAAGQSWHWVDPARALPRAAELLSPEGFLALWWNRPRRVAGDLWEALGPIYERLEPAVMDQGQPRAQWTTTEATVYGIHRSALFDEPEVHLFPWQERLDSRAYVERLRTHSGHRALSDDRLDALLQALREAIDELGGHVEVGSQVDLVMARVEPTPR